MLFKHFEEISTVKNKESEIRKYSNKKGSPLLSTPFFQYYSLIKLAYRAISMVRDRYV